MKKIIFMGFAAICLSIIACSSSKTEDVNRDGMSFSLFSGIKASKTYITKKVKIKDISSIVNKSSLDVTYKHGSYPHVEMYMPDNVMPYIALNTSNKELTISLKENTIIRWRNNNKAKIIVYAPSVNNFSLIGSGNLTVSETLNRKSCQFQLSGSGNINLRDVKVSDNIKANLAGSGNFNILNMKTTADNGCIALSVSGSGNVNASEISTKSLTTGIAGSGNLNIATIITDSSTASITGSGNMKLKGRTNKASFSVTGSGEISAGIFRAKDVYASVTGSGQITCYATGKTNFKSVHKSSIINVAK